jgi:DNA-binding NtrC family response regulator
MSELNAGTLPVLVVDDEEQILHGCRIVLRSSGITNIICCQDSREVIGILSNRHIGVILLDLSMPHLTGEELLPLIREEYPEIPIIVITGANEVETAVRCMKQGSFDYLVKPVEKSRLVSIVKRALEIRNLERENRLLRQRILTYEIECPEAFKNIITSNEKMRAIFQYIEAIAKTGQPVLITGETGVGKELMAKAIHDLSGLKGDFIAVNVSGLDDTLFADTLFGHKKGAYTSASESRNGLVQKASNGTLFLDEIGELSFLSQVKLLRLIQEKEYLPLGSDMVKHSDARIVVATNQNLRDLINSKQFRKDLYFRLQTHHVHLPPLRDRLDDLLLLVDHFLGKAARSLNKKKPTPPPELFTLLSTYHFPGNIRELESMIFDSVSKHTSRKLSLDVFKERIFQDNQPHQVKSDLCQPDKKSLFSFSEELPTIKEVTRLLIAEAMKRAKGNQTIAAHILGISQQALSARLKRYREDG